MEQLQVPDIDNKFSASPDVRKMGKGRNRLVSFTAYMDDEEPNGTEDNNQPQNDDFFTKTLQPRRNGRTAVSFNSSRAEF